MGWFLLRCSAQSQTDALELQCGGVFAEKVGR